MADMNILSVVGQALHAQSTRLNTVASNLANVGQVAGSAEAVYKRIEPRFEVQPVNEKAGLSTARVAEIVEFEVEPIKRYEPGNPMADPEGYVYAPNIDPVAQMVNMISSARSFQANVEVFNTAKELAIATINIGR